MAPSARASSEDSALAIGHEIEGYRIEAVLGHGGFGVTYRAQDLDLDTPIALKEYLPSQIAARGRSMLVAPRSKYDQEAFNWGLKRFLEEARTLARFKHPNIARVLRLFEANGTAYMAMSYEGGSTLARHIKRRSRRPTQAELMSLFLPLLDGIEAVHAAGFLHRDIQPANILIRTDGSPVLVDFGTARQSISDQAQTLNSVLTAGYAPLEQYAGVGLQGPWTDIYSLAATMYCCLMGVAPPDATDRNLRQLEESTDTVLDELDTIEGIDGHVLAAIAHGLELSVSGRPQTIPVFREELIGEKPVADTIDEGSKRRTPSSRSMAEMKAAAAKADEATRIRRPAADTPKKRAETASPAASLAALIKKPEGNDRVVIDTRPDKPEAPASGPIPQGGLAASGPLGPVTYKPGTVADNTGTESLLGAEEEEEDIALSRPSKAETAARVFDVAAEEAPDPAPKPAPHRPSGGKGQRKTSRPQRAEAPAKDSGRTGQETMWVIAGAALLLIIVGFAAFQIDFTAVMPMGADTASTTPTTAAGGTAAAPASGNGVDQGGTVGATQAASTQAAPAQAAPTTQSAPTQSITAHGSGVANGSRHANGAVGTRNGPASQNGSRFGQAATRSDDGDRSDDRRLSFLDNGTRDTPQRIHRANAMRCTQAASAYWQSLIQRRGRAAGTSQWAPGLTACLNTVRYDAASANNQFMYGLMLHANGQPVEAERWMQAAARQNHELARQVLASARR